MTEQSSVKKTARIPPNNNEAEQAVLGAMLLSEKCVFEAVEALKEEDFYQQQHRLIYRAMSDLTKSGSAVDLVTVAKRMEKEGQLGPGAVEYLSGLTDTVPSLSNLKYYIEIIKDCAGRRFLIDTCVQAADDCYKGEYDVEEIANSAASAILKLAMGGEADNRLQHISTVLRKSYAFISEAMNSEDGIIGIPTGYPLLDKTLAGLQGGQLIVIAGRPGMGKTSFAMNLIENIALRKDQVCLVFSLEMAAEQLGLRLLCSQSGVDSQQARHGRLGEGEINQFVDAVKNLSGTKIYIDDTADITPTKMLAKAQNLKKNKGLGLIAIDYLQLMRDDSRAEARHLEVARITRALKIMAKELNVPILLLSQLSRNSEKSRSSDSGRPSKPHYPRLSDLRESGAIEQDADVVIFLHREDYYDEDKTPENMGKARVIIAKQRSGPTGVIQMMWRGELTRYDEIDFVREEREEKEEEEALF